MDKLSVIIRRGTDSERIDFDVLKSNQSLSLIKTDGGLVWIDNPGDNIIRLQINQVNQFVDETINSINNRYPVRYVRDAKAELVCVVEYDVLELSSIVQRIEIDGVMTNFKPLVKHVKQRAIGRACKIGEPGNWFVSKNFFRQRLQDSGEHPIDTTWAGEAAFRLQFNEALERLENKQL